MRAPRGDCILTAELDGLRSRFAESPTDALAFDTLEEGFFVSGDWNALVALYDERLGAADLKPERNPKARARLINSSPILPTPTTPNTFPYSPSA